MSEERLTLAQLKSQSPKELLALAEDLEIENASTMRKGDMMFAILKERAEDGWQIGGTPIITADWEAKGSDVWTVPIGLGIYKTHFFGKMPIKLGIEGQYKPIRPDSFGQEYNIRIVIAPIIPNFFK